VQCRIPLIVNGVNLCTAVEQHFHHGALTHDGRLVQERHAACIAQGDAGAVPEQDARGIDVGGGDGAPEGGVGVAAGEEVHVCCVGVGEQGGERFDVPGPGGEVEGCVACSVLGC
jgi:hypothetical protein